MAGLVILSYLPHPSHCGLSRRVDGIEEALESTVDEVVVICPSFREGFSHKDPRVDPVKIPLRLEGADAASRFLRLALYSLLSLRKIVRYAMKGYLVQYESVFSAFPALVTKLFVRRTVIGDDLVRLHAGSSLLSPLIFVVEAVLARLTDYCLTASLRTLPFLKRFSRNVIYIPNGVKCPVRRDESMRDETTILFVGALTFDQNRVAVNKIFQISSLLSSIRPEASIVVVGGPETITASLRNHPLAKVGRTRFLGEVSDSILERIYAEAFIGLLPFFSETPTLGGARIKALEYFAHGLLVVSGVEGVFGIGGLNAGEHFLAAATVEEMCHILDECLASPEKYYAVAEAGRERVLALYSWKTVTREYVKQVKRLFEKRGAYVLRGRHQEC